MSELVDLVVELHEGSLARITEQLGPERGTAFTQMKDRVVADPEKNSDDIDRMLELVREVNPAYFHGVKTFPTPFRGPVMLRTGHYIVNVSMIEGTKKR